MQKPILDVCCGSKMFWFDKQNQHAVFCDFREVEEYEYYPGRRLEVKPDVVCDFTALPFLNKTFKLVVFDPPHLVRAGEQSYMRAKYGVLPADWREMLQKGFAECMRVLDDYGVLVFKWNETQVATSEVIKAIGKQPLFGHKSGKREKTHWLCFMKT